MTQKKSKSAKPRSAARLAAVQALYAWEMGEGSPSSLIEDFVQKRLGGKAFISDEDGFSEHEENLADPDVLLLAEIVRGAIENKDKIDAMLSAALSEEWPLERLEAIMRAILRAGAWELFAISKTPVKVAISEYIDIAHAFYAGTETRLVNAVLDKIARVVRDTTP